MEKCVYALGNFDGVHKGHYAVIKSAIDIARELGIKAKALTFEPHPREVLNPSGEPFRLTSFDQKRRLILSIGMDDVVKVDFSAHTANMSAEEFVRSLASTTAHIVAGHDFAFGKGRSGNMSTLAKIAETMEIGVTEVPALLGDGEALSSTKIRDLLKAGLPEQAAWILGRPWRVCGIVIKGAERGRQIGIRTANIELGRFLRPKFGVYAIKAYRAGEDMPISGVANIVFYNPTKASLVATARDHNISIHSPVGIIPSDQ